MELTKCKKCAAMFSQPVGVRRPREYCNELCRKRAEGDRYRKKYPRNRRKKWKPKDQQLRREKDRLRKQEKRKSNPSYKEEMKEYYKRKIDEIRLRKLKFTNSQKALAEIVGLANLRVVLEEKLHESEGKTNE